ncbi:MAG TPA: hypothetical protein VHL99_04470 [Candidatus Binatia bacterium]|nr:hypothetical protein [Candidatus Binatia bacterium]
MEFRGLKSRYDRLKTGWRRANLAGSFALAVSVRRFLSETITLERANEGLQAALADRADKFLALARARVYARPSSPFLKLLRRCGCDYADLEQQVRRHGLEATLERLAAEGVYLTAEEAKGKKEVVRGNESFRVDPRSLENTDLAANYFSQSSGTNNRPTTSAASLDRLATWALVGSVLSAAHDLFSCSHAVYDAMLPSGGGVRNLLINAKLGITTERWFARTAGPMTLGGRYYHFMTRLIVLAGKSAGRSLPMPEFIAVDDLRHIVDWVREESRRGKRCCITTAASNAVRIARVAAEMTVSLAGMKFLATGEPLTPTKRELIERVGAVAIPVYGFEDLAVRVGCGCPHPARTDEMHVNWQDLAVTEHSRTLPDGSDIRPLLFTSLQPLSPRFFLNVENGDYATLAQRDCGCPLEKAGLTLHISDVRSFEKFTSEGMNYFYGDLFELFERILPAEFGGGPGDYQLVEEEDASGQTRLTLLLHPSVAGVDEKKLIARLKEALRSGASGGRFMTEVWQTAGTFRVRREPPRASARGKILPLHVSR